MPAPLRVGLTGGLASGKSTVASFLAEAGYLVVDADRLVAELYAPGEPGARLVAELFGSSLLEDSGAVDKARLGALVFSDDRARAQLESAIHPLVRERFAQRVAESDRPIVLEATRLVEAGYGPDFDYLLTVEAPFETRLARAVARGMSQEDATARLSAQGEGEARRQAADRILENDGDLEELRAATDAIVDELRDRERRR